MKSTSARELLYLENKKKRNGEECKCPVCGKTFIKKQYSQAFCCTHCKDDFHNKKGDRHSKGYHHRYNAEHPERLERGFTKGYVDGKVSNGTIKPKYKTDEYGNRILGYDEFGLPITTNTLSDLIREKEMIWHDDDWCEEPD